MADLAGTIWMVLSYLAILTAVFVLAGGMDDDNWPGGTVG